MEEWVSVDPVLREQHAVASLMDAVLMLDRGDGGLTTHGYVEVYLSQEAFDSIKLSVQQRGPTKFRGCKSISDYPIVVRFWPLES